MRCPLLPPMPLRRGGALPLSAPRAAAGGLRGGGGRGAALLHPTCLSPPGTTGRALGLRLALLIVVFYPLLEFCYKIKKKETPIGNWVPIRLSSVLGASEIGILGVKTNSELNCRSYWEAGLQFLLSLLNMYLVPVSFEPVWIGGILGEQQFYLLQFICAHISSWGCVLRRFRGTFSISGCLCL